MSEIVAVSKVSEQLNLITDSSAAFRATFKTDTEQGQDMAFAALSDSEPLAEHLGEVIELVHFIGQPVTVTQEATGELLDTVRIILIDANGRNYSALSDQLLKSITTMCSVYGAPATWTKPKPIVITEQRSNKGRRFFAARPATKAELAAYAAK